LWLLLGGGLWELLLLGIVGVPRGIRLVVGVVRSSHTVQHGMTAKVVRSKLDHCRHLGECATNRPFYSNDLIRHCCSFREATERYPGDGVWGQAVDVLPQTEPMMVRRPV
jgi:hypothetical protein